MSDSIFTQKKIEVSFTIFDSNGNQETRTFNGLRVSCQIVNAGVEAGSMCALRIEGMSLSVMNALSVVQAGIIAQSNNTVTVRASDGGQWQEVFYGGVTEAFVDLGGAPNVAFMVTSMSMSILSAVKISTTQFNGAVAVADILQAIATKAGLTFENNGVTAVTSGSVYYEGTAADQLYQVRRAFRIVYFVSMNTLRVWPYEFLADEQYQVEVSADTGMMGYPAYSQGGTAVRTLFNSQISFHTTIKLSSQYSPAGWLAANGQISGVSGGATHLPSNGLWVVVNVQHDLQSETPDGQWTTYFEAARPDMAGQVYFGI